MNSISESLIHSEDNVKIAQSFLKVKNADSLAIVLNMVGQYRTDNLPVQAKKYTSNPITCRTINFFAFHLKDRYTNFDIPKKAGGVRTIKSPVYGLKRIQRALNFCFQEVFIPRQAAHGFIKGRSIVSNAAPHVGKRFVYNIDLKDFFTSTNFGRVHAILKLDPFGFSDEVAFLIANLCTDNGSLPQGAPTSPTLTNLVCQRLDRRLVYLAKKHRCVFTRYADDITFSSNRRIFTDLFHSELNCLLTEEGYNINPGKVRLQSFAERQEVTGIIVNDKTNVTRAYLKNVRAMLNHWECWGYDKANAFHKQRYISEKGILRNSGKVPPLKQVLGGKIYYLGMVRGNNDPKYLEYLKLFNTLIGKNNDELDLDIQTLNDLRMLAQGI